MEKASERIRNLKRAFIKAASSREFLIEDILPILLEGDLIFKHSYVNNFGLDESCAFIRGPTEWDCLAYSSWGLKDAIIELFGIHKFFGEELLLSAFTNIFKFFEKKEEEVVVDGVKYFIFNEFDNDPNEWGLYALRKKGSFFEDGE